MAGARKTADEYRLFADYGFGHGWEHETSEETGSAIRERLREYRVNAPQYSYKISGPHRVPLS